MKGILKLKPSIIFFFGAVGGLIIGFSSGVIAGVGPLLENDFKLNPEEYGTIAAAILFGAVIGALTIGSLSDKLGRKKVMLICAIIFFIATFACAYSSDYITFSLSRALLGLAVGGTATLSPVYLADLAPKAKRGIIGALFQMMVIFGILLSYIISLVFLDHNILGISDWRWMVGFAFLPAVLVLLGSIILPESPRFLIKIGQIESARNTLNHLRSEKDDIEAEIEEITSSFNTPKGTLSDLFKVAKPALLVGLGLSFFQQFVGINGVLYFLPEVFIKGFGFSDEYATIISIVIGTVNLIVAIVATVIMDKHGRKSFLLFGSIMMAVSLGLISVLDYCLPIHDAPIPTIILLSFYILGFSISWGPIAWLMLGEIFPQSVRAIGASVATAFNYLANIAITASFPFLLEVVFNDSIGGPFAVFAVFAALSIVFVLKKVPETKGKSLEEIEQHFVVSSK